MEQQTNARKHKNCHAIEAWQIAQTIKIGGSIPADEQPDLRSELYLKYAEHAAYFEGAANFGGAVRRSMDNDIRDEISHRKTQKAQFFASIQSLDAGLEKDGEDETLDVADPNLTLEDFLGGLDRKDRRRRMRNWRRKFRRRVLRLDDSLADFLFKLTPGITQQELMAATGYSRKTCFNRRQQLKQIFEDLLREHRDIRALEIK